MSEELSQIDRDKLSGAVAETTKDLFILGAALLTTLRCETLQARDDLEGYGTIAVFVVRGVETIAQFDAVQKSLDTSRTPDATEGDAA